MLAEFKGFKVRLQSKHTSGWLKINFLNRPSRVKHSEATLFKTKGLAEQTGAAIHRSVWYQVKPHYKLTTLNTLQNNRKVTA